MRHVNGTHWESVERWSPTLFLSGGALLAGHAAVKGIEAFTEIVPPPDLFVTTGHLVALVGLIGLYPVLVEGTPRVARAALASAVIPILGWSIMTSVQFLAAIGVLSSMATVLPDMLIVLVVASTILTYGLFGAATLRTGERSRFVGSLVLAPPFLFLVMIVDGVSTGTSALDGALIGAGLALSMLTLGYGLRRWDRRIEQAAPTTDATPG